MPNAWTHMPKACGVMRGHICLMHGHICLRRGHVCLRCNLPATDLSHSQSSDNVPGMLLRAIRKRENNCVATARSWQHARCVLRVKS